MDNFRLGEVSTEIAEPPTRVAEMESIYFRLKKLEERMDLMMALKTANNIDMSKFTCDIPPLGSNLPRIEIPLRKVEPNFES